MGDPTLLGWATTLSYLGAALRCRRAGRRPGVHRADSQVWRILSGACLLLGLNKQLDLQTHALRAVKWGARTFGFVDYKQQLRWLFLLLVLLLGTAAFGHLRALGRQSTFRPRLAGTGFGLVLLYAALRAFAFSGLARHPLGAALGGLVELGGVLLIAAAAGPGSKGLVS